MIRLFDQSTALYTDFLECSTTFWQILEITNQQVILERRTPHLRLIHRLHHNLLFHQPMPANVNTLVSLYSYILWVPFALIDYVKNAADEFRTHSMRRRGSIRQQNVEVTTHLNRWSAAQRAWWSRYRTSKQALLRSTSVQRHRLKRCDVQCKSCGALHWLEERTRGVGSSDKYPIFSSCCAAGKVSLPDLIEPDEYLRSFFEGDSPGMYYVSQGGSF